MKSVERLSPALTPSEIGTPIDALSSPAAARVEVVLPIHNEGEQVAKSVAEVARFARLHLDYKFTFIDDGSSDNTADVAQLAIDAAGLDVISLIRVTPNGGKCRAVRAGLVGSRSSLVCFLDGDLAYPLEMIPKLVSALESHDIAIASRGLANVGQARPGLGRRVLGQAFNSVTRLLLGLHYTDTQAGLKAFRASAARRLFKVQLLRDFAFDAELLFLAGKFGLRVAEVPAVVSADHASRPSSVRLVGDSLRMLRSLAVVRFNHWRGRYA